MIHLRVMCAYIWGSGKQESFALLKLARTGRISRFNSLRALQPPSTIATSNPRDPKGDLASSDRSLRDGDDCPHLLELRFNKLPPQRGRSSPPASRRILLLRRTGADQPSPSRRDVWGWSAPVLRDSELCLPHHLSPHSPARDSAETLYSTG